MFVIMTAILLCIAIAVIIVFPPSSGKMSSFLDENGNQIEGSISEKIHVDINGTSLGMFVTAKDSTKPVLLVLGGGPGIPEYLLEQMYPTDLKENFVVCYLEYRGTSLSYDSDVSVNGMTTKQYLADVNAVTNYLRERFGRDKIYLLAHSFGTYIGLQAATEHPESYLAYIAMSQITNQKHSEEIAYSYMLEQYKVQGNEKMVKKFNDCPILTDEVAYSEYFTSSLRDTAMHELGVGTTHDMHSVITGIFFPSLRCTAYTQAERINIWRGKVFAQNTPVVTDSFDFNAFETVQELQIPIYFLAGAYDYTCAYSLQQDYYEYIQAPVKGFYTFKDSAHSPLFEEREKALEILLTDVLNGQTTRID